MTHPPKHDPERWPLAPGNASAEYEELAARIKTQWKVPLDERQLAVIQGAFSRARHVNEELRHM